MISLLIVLHQMICLQVSSDTVILIYNQQTECIDGSTDRGVSVQAGGLSLQLIYRTHSPNWFWFLFIFLTKNIDVKFGTYGTERSWDCCHSQRWHRELGTQVTCRSLPEGFWPFQKGAQQRVRKEIPAEVQLSETHPFNSGTEPAWARTGTRAKGQMQRHTGDNLRVKSALQSSVYERLLRKLLGPLPILSLSFKDLAIQLSN